MEASLQTYGIRQIKEMIPSLDDHGIRDDFLLCEISRDNPEENHHVLQLLRYPLRFNGYLGLLCLSGSFMVDINVNSFLIGPESLLLIIPGSIVHFHLHENETNDAHLLLVALSEDFMSGIRFDFNQIIEESLNMLENPCVTLTPNQMGIARDFFVLSQTLLRSPARFKVEIICGLLSSLVYLMADIWVQYSSNSRKRKKAQARPRLIFARFLALVTEFHTQERNVAFYAEKINLTPKYLSKLIKQVSGRSAPEWIDSFVILEAKNLLKYSKHSIKQIVFLLHFPNQSVFYKFFKAHTGLTPSQYRNS